MKVSEIVTEARRVLNDTRATGWSDPRLLDIFNRGMRDIARHANMYRKEHIIELTNGRNRYPLPTDLLKITDLYLADESLPILSKLDRPTETYASKDQINLGILEINPIPKLVREPMFFDGRIGATTAVSSTQGVASSPVASLFGVTASLVVPLDTTNRQLYGILTGIAVKGEDYLVHYKNSGDTHGVLTAINMPTVAGPKTSGLVEHRDTMRIVGRYGLAGSAVRTDRRLHIYYKSLPPKVRSSEQAFPLSPQWEDLMVDWIIGTALADDNDSSNQQRSQVFIQRYLRNLKVASADSAENYNSTGNPVEYKGSITANGRGRKRRRG